MSYTHHPYWDIANQGPYTPFPWQAEHIHAHDESRFLIAACGRRAGKTVGMQREVEREATRPSKMVLGKLQHPLVYVVGPTHELAERIFSITWDAFVSDDRGEHLAPLDFLHARHDKTRGIIWLKSGAVIQRKSGDDPKSLQGDRVTAAVVDESHSMPEDSWKYLLPSLMDSGGRLLAIGVSMGKNRFRSMWDMGREGVPGYYSCSVPSTAHPLIVETVAEAEALTEQTGMEHIPLETDPAFLALSERERRQMYYAEWMEDDGSIFPKPVIDSCNTGHYKDAPEPDGVYLAGLDVAKAQDWTWLLVGNVKTGEIVYGERFQGIEYMTQAPRIARICRDWNVRAVNMDVTGVGAAVAEIFRAEGVPISEFMFTNKSKAEIINVTVREMERGNVILPQDPILTRELELFEHKSTPAGVVTYSAPPGYHDDGVISLSLLVAKMYRNRGMTQNPNRKPYVTWGTQKSTARMPALPGVAEKVAA
ncbi:hypothetical protein LCGC14_1198810 [marine sediment metagenome]|uniref:Terminase large subunit gp17-like C-terminal domain-containing protein n=1 Tax=marine sediment metagenome TaxID=412755 RepID=A0A0F9LM23_9ZZZZ